MNEIDNAQPHTQSAWWEDIIDVFLSPAELFERRRHSPVAPPLFMLLGCSIAIYLLTLPANAIIMRASMPANPQAAAMIEQWGMLFTLVGAIFVPIGLLVGVAFSALLIWLFGKLFDLPTAFGSAVTIATYAGFIFLLAQIAGSIVVLFLGEGRIDNVQADLSFGLLRFLDADALSAPLLPLLQRLDIFAIWQAVLLAIGVRVVYRATAVQAGVVAALTWALSALPQVVMAALTPGPTG